MAHAIASYVPRLVFDRLAAGRGFDGPEWSRLEAAVLLGDIRGSTEIMEHCSRAGPEGLESLTWDLNAYFGDFVTTVNEYGGDVLFIAGDAFLCFWPTSDATSLPAAAEHAAKAALVLQERLHGRVAGPNRHFAMRVGVGAGELIIAFVGGVGGRWQLVTAGSAFHQAVETEHIAPPGRVRLSRACEGMLGDNIRVSEDGQDSGPLLDALIKERAAPQLAPRTDDLQLETAIRAFAPPAIVDRLLLDDAQWLAEGRQVTVLLADLAMPLEVSEATRHETHESVRAFQEAVYRFDGTLKIDVDNKGILLLAIFGLPPFAHEDNAQRAVECAWSLHTSLERRGIHSGSGIATGKAICGSFGNDLRREYMLRGEVINTASRLMSTSDNGPVCDEATRDAIGDRLRFETLESLDFKGISDRVSRYRPSGRVEASATPRNALVGRVEERRVLVDMLDGVAAGGDGALVIVEGEAGLGKTTLLANLAAHARDAGLRVLSGAADPVNTGNPYLAWREILRGVLGISEGEPASMARLAVAQQLDSNLGMARFVPLLNMVLPFGIPETPLTEEMSGEVRAENLRRLFGHLLLRLAASEPVVIILDDAHWMDSSSLELTADVAAVGAPLLFVVGTRRSDGPAHAAIRRLGDVRDAHRIVLDGMSEDDTGALIQNALGVRSVPRELVETVFQRSGGNPFFCEELVRTLRNAGSIRVDDNVCEVGNLQLEDLPPTVEGAILARLDSLPPEQQLCLKVAAIVGQSFTLRAVRDALPLNDEKARVALHLAALSEQGLTWLEAVHPESVYQFRHAITREVTYGLMTRSQLLPLHRAVAEWYEHRYCDDIAPHCAIIAHHWENAGESYRAVPYLADAGEQALRNGMFKEATSLYSSALDISVQLEEQPSVETRARWTRQLGLAHYFLGELDTSRQLLEQAVAALDRPIPTTPMSLGLALTSNLFRQIGHRNAPALFLAKAAHRAGPLADAVDCYKILGQIYYLAGEPAPRLSYMTLRGLNAGEATGPSAPLACIMSNMGVMTGLVGLKAAAQRYADRAIAMAEGQGQYAASAYVWHINAIQCAQDGSWVAALHANDQAISLVKALDDFNLEAEAHVVRATVELARGNFDAAPSAWRRSRELAERSGNAQIECWSYLDEVDTLLGADDVDGAQRALDIALGIPTAQADGSSTGDKQRALATTALRRGKFDDALAAAREVVSLVTRQPPTGYHWVDFFASAVEVQFAVCEAGPEGVDVTALRREARRALKKLHGMKRTFWNVKPRAELLESIALAVENNPGAAAKRLRKAITVAVDMRMPYERARAQLELATRCNPSDANALLDAAARQFEDLGAHYYLRLCNEAMQRD